MNQYISFIDVLIGPILIIIFYIIARSVKKKHIELQPYYKYFIPGLFIKVMGGIAVCLVYVYYYEGGGDTICYYHDNVCISRLFLKNPMAALQFTFSEMNISIWENFDNYTDWPIFGMDLHAVYVDKITWPLSLITFNSFIGQTMILSFLSFLTIWRLYKMFLIEFPTLHKGLAISFLFIPSVIFWGSGLLKDTITFSAIALFTSSFYFIMKKSKNNFINLVLLIVCSWILIKIKPYILFAILPGTVIWFTSYRLENVKNKLVRKAITPSLIALALLVSFIFLKIMGDSLNEYAVSNVLERAMISQQDLKQNYYHGNSFDIGDFDPTIQGVLAKAPIAIISTLFRPFIWESNNVVMFASGIENFAILLFSVYLLFRLRIYNLMRLIFSNHILFFCVSFSLFFAFAVGLSTSNFGSLVRYKIPAIPFFIASLVITNYYYKQNKAKGAEAVD